MTCGKPRAILRTVSAPRRARGAFHPKHPNCDVPYKKAFRATPKPPQAHRLSRGRRPANTAGRAPVLHAQARSSDTARRTRKNFRNRRVHRRAARRHEDNRPRVVGRLRGALPANEGVPALQGARRGRHTQPRLQPQLLLNPDGRKRPRRRDARGGDDGFVRSPAPDIPDNPAAKGL